MVAGDKVKTTVVIFNYNPVYADAEITNTEFTVRNSVIIRGKLEWVVPSKLIRTLH